MLQPGDICSVNADKQWGVVGVAPVGAQGKTSWIPNGANVLVVGTFFYHDRLDWCYVMFQGGMFEIDANLLVKLDET